MANTKRRKKNTNTPKKPSKTAQRQLKAVIWFAFSIFFICVVFIKGENIWSALHNFIFGVFGITAFFYPFYLCMVAILYAVDKIKERVGSKILLSGILALLIGAAIDIFITPADSNLKFIEHITNAYKLGVSLKGGGFIGAFLGEPIALAFGKTGAIITILLLIFVFLMIVTGTTLLALFKGVSRSVKTISERAETAYEGITDTIQSDNTDASNGKRKKKIKLMKDFDVDIPVDDIPEERDTNTESLGDKQKKVINTYYDKENSTDNEDTADRKISAALKNVEEENAVEEIDFAEETAKVENEINSGISLEEDDGYKFPPMSLLNAPDFSKIRSSAAELDSTAEHLVQTLRSFGVETRIVDISRGPTVTRYELQPCAGVKISKITNLADDIALNLAAAGVRIEAPIPNKAAVGIEVPNKSSAVVGVREIIESPEFSNSKSKLTVAMGKDIGGNVIVTDISKMPHGLIAGATGSGKSVCINSIIMSILYKATPEEVKLLMIDPKVVELGIYNGIPHLLVPVVTEPRKAAGALGWAVEEMEKRYKMFADRGVRDLEGYNKFVDALKDEPEVKKMPHIVIIIDELADLMMTAPHEVEDSINRIAAKARAAGMHLLIATQRPSVDVVTGVIKANIPTRIAFAVSSQVDSRTILDSVGAEKLLGRGDMLFSPAGSTKPNRLQGCFISDEEVEAVVSYIKNGDKPEYDDNIMYEIERQAAVEKQKKTGLAEDGPDEDPMIKDAIRVVVENGQASTSLLQRKLKLGYARAARIVDEMETRGVVGPYEGSKPRKVLITMDELMEMEAGES